MLMQMYTSLSIFFVDICQELDTNSDNDKQLT